MVIEWDITGPLYARSLPGLPGVDWSSKLLQRAVLPGPLYLLAASRLSQLQVVGMYQFSLKRLWRKRIGNTRKGWAATMRRRARLIISCSSYWRLLVSSKTRNRCSWHCEQQRHEKGNQANNNKKWWRIVLSAPSEYLVDFELVLWRFSRQGGTQKPTWTFRSVQLMDALSIVSNKRFDEW